MGKKIEHNHEAPKGRPVAADPHAASTNCSLPAFIGKPSGVPVYHGFPVLHDVDVEGFKLGKISDFELELMDSGDGFVEAPDGSRAGLVWEISARTFFEMVLPIEAKRWGVWRVGFLYPMRTRHAARDNLRLILPELRKQWSAWKHRFADR